jgi:hypothetical protein
MNSWKVENLAPGAVGLSASRRTDIPALFSRWFANRLEAGFVQYVPAGPPRRIRASLAPRDVTHMTFWSKWPRPFFGVLDRLLERGYPVLWNVTITGLGGTPAEPGVPEPARAVAAVRELAHRVPPAAIQWRFDPIFLTSAYPRTFHLEAFRRLAGELAGHVDRMTTSFLVLYRRQVKPDLRRYEEETGDRTLAPIPEEAIDLAGRIRDLAAEAGVPFTVCCSPALQAALRCDPASCNGWEWVTRVYPRLRSFPPLRRRPTREGCACSRELDIGVYDTCTLGCRYCYAVRDPARARSNRRRHDPEGPCLLGPDRRSGCPD